MICLIYCALSPAYRTFSWSLFQAPGSIRTGMFNSYFSIFFCWFVHRLFSSWTLADIDQSSSTSCIYSMCIDIFSPQPIEDYQSNSSSTKHQTLKLRDSFSVPHIHLENWKVLTGYLVIINRPLEWYWKLPVALSCLVFFSHTIFVIYFTSTLLERLI